MHDNKGLTRTFTGRDRALRASGPVQREVRARVEISGPSYRLADWVGRIV